MTRVRLLACILLGWEWVGLAPAIAQPLSPASPSTASGPAENAPFPSLASLIEQQTRQPRPRFRVEWKPGPVFQFGDVLRFELIAKFHLDARRFDPRFDEAPDAVELTRKRLGVAGELYRKVEFEFEMELRRENPVRDAFVGVAWTRFAEFRAGKHKMPFSRDELTSDFRHDFIYRSRIADSFAPARDVGATTRGALADRAVAWETGVFRGDGENARFGDNPGAGPTVAARVTARPFRSKRFPASTRRVELGLSATAGSIEQGLNSLRIVSVGDVDIFSPVYVNGARRRFGVDLQWRVGPASLCGEGIAMYDERRNQGLADEDLSDVLGRGWYASGSWLLTGEEKRDDVKPRRNFVSEGIGALELAARYEFIRMGSRDHPGEPFRNPRAENILGNSDRAWTFGVNWYWNPFSKLQLNAIREDIEDRARSPVPGRDVFWSYVARLQFVM